MVSLESEMGPDLVNILDIESPMLCDCCYMVYVCTIVCKMCQQK